MKPNLYFEEEDIMRWICLFFLIFTLSCSFSKLLAPKDMVLVKGGTFTMGDTAGGGKSDEKPTHQVTLSSFYLGKYEVTQKQWQEVMGNNPSFKKGDNFPVDQVSWYECVKFCNKLSQKENLTPCYTIDSTHVAPTNLNTPFKIITFYKTNRNVTVNWNANGYRLPTEAEWEYAAKGGKKSKGYKYSGSNDIGSVAWYDGDSTYTTIQGGQKKANELGLYDMSGNVLEWCWDWYDENYYSKSLASNPKGAADGATRVTRGGSHSDVPSDCTVSVRTNMYAVICTNHIGFRVCRALP
jgi:formylglycine-generating enzyme